MRILTAGIFVRAVCAIFLSITEKVLAYTDGISACKLVVLTERLISAEQRLHLLLLGQLITVLHSPLPITRLLLQVEGEARGASDGLQALIRERLRNFGLSERPTYSCSALDDVPAGVFARLQPEQLARAFVLAKLRLVGLCLLIVLADNPCKEHV